MHEIVALVVDVGLGASALYLARSLNRTVTALDALVKNHETRIKALEDKK